MEIGRHDEEIRHLIRLIEDYSVKINRLVMNGVVLSPSEDVDEEHDLELDERIDKASSRITQIRTFSLIVLIFLPIIILFIFSLLDYFRLYKSEKYEYVFLSTIFTFSSVVYFRYINGLSAKRNKTNSKKILRIQMDGYLRSLHRLLRISSGFLPDSRGHQAIESRDISWPVRIELELKMQEAESIISVVRPQGFSKYVDSKDESTPVVVFSDTKI